MISFSKLLELHSELDHAFAAHQHALVRFEFDLALRRLQHYESALIAHMSDEEKFLFPLYAERALIEIGGAVKFFLDDHEKMRGWLRVFVDATKELKTTDEPEKLLIELLDRESFYKRLCTHHDIRESKYLFPALDAVTTDDERTELFKQFVGPSAVAGALYAIPKTVVARTTEMRP